MYKASTATIAYEWSDINYFVQKKTDVGTSDQKKKKIEVSEGS